MTWVDDLIVSAAQQYLGIVAIIIAVWSFYYRRKEHRLQYGRRVAVIPREQTVSISDETSETKHKVRLSNRGSALLQVEDVRLVFVRFIGGLSNDQVSGFMSFLRMAATFADQAYAIPRVRAQIEESLADPKVKLGPKVRLLAFAWNFLDLVRRRPTKPSRERAVDLLILARRMEKESFDEMEESGAGQIWGRFFLEGEVLNERTFAARFNSEGGRPLLSEAPVAIPPNDWIDLEVDYGSLYRACLQSFEVVGRSFDIECVIEVWVHDANRPSRSRSVEFRVTLPIPNLTDIDEGLKRALVSLAEPPLPEGSTPQNATS